MAIDSVSLVYPFTAGVFVLFSPCGYALLPGYISYYLGSEVTVPRALKGGVTSTLGLIAIFSAIGLGASLIGGLIKPYITLFTVFAAVILIILGVLILAEVNLPSPYIQIVSSNRRGLTGFFIFGIAYGLAAAGCTAPIFFSIILIAVMGSGAFGGLLTFLLYALGVGFPLIVTSILVATAKRPLISRIRNLTPRLYRLSGVVLILVGIYLIYLYFTSGLLPLV
ncbi:MAG: cytochrome c biogenesis CcdA family protein [Nitrososphaerales archaeon]